MKGGQNEHDQKIVTKANGSKTVIENGKITTNFSGPGQTAPTAQPETFQQPSTTPTAEHSTIGAAFTLFHKKETNDDTLTTEGAHAIVNMANKAPEEQRLQIILNVYNQLDDDEKLQFVQELKTSDPDMLDIPTGYYYGGADINRALADIAYQEDTEQKVLHELANFPNPQYNDASREWDYPEYVRIARHRENITGKIRTMLKRIATSLNKNKRWIAKSTAYVGSTAALGGTAGFIALGPVGAVIGAVAGPFFVGGTIFFVNYAEGNN